MGQTTDVQMRNRIEWGHLVVWSIDTHLTSITEALDGLAGMDQDEWRGLFDELRDELACATAHLEFTHVRLNDCLAAADSQKQILELATQHLHLYMMKIRDVLDDRGLLYFAMDGKLPPDAEALAELALSASDALGSVNEELREDPTVQALARELEICEQKLSKEIDLVLQKELPVQAMLSARAQAQALWTLAYRRVGGIFHHALTLANCPAAAELVRPTLHRTSGQAPLPSATMLGRIERSTSAPRLRL